MRAIKSSANVGPIRLGGGSSQYASVDLRAKSFELPHDTPPLLLSLLFLGLVSPRPAPLLCFPFDILCEQRGVFTVVCNNNLLFADLEIVERDATGLDLVRSSGLGGNLNSVRKSCRRRVNR